MQPLALDAGRGDDHGTAQADRVVAQGRLEDSTRSTAHNGVTHGKRESRGRADLALARRDGQLAILDVVDPELSTALGDRVILAFIVIEKFV